MNPRPDLAPLETVGTAGHRLFVPLADGSQVPYADLDHAASTAALPAVWDALAQFAPWYSSVHRGAGWTSQVATMAFEASRSAVSRFVGARPDDVVVFARSTTEAINQLAHALALSEEDAVVVGTFEHHANLLPWRRHARIVELPVPQDAGDLLDRLEALLAADPSVRVVAMTGASNVTGEVMPLAQVAAVAHAHDAYLFVDGAQLAPHRPVDMAASQVDAFAFSGHKMYAPFGGGALIARPEMLRAPEPLVVGGGAVTLVTRSRVAYRTAPEGMEAGTPNVLGAVAVAAAAHCLRTGGLEQVAAHEDRLLRRLVGSVSGVRGLTWYRMWDAAADRVAVFAFNLDGLHHSTVAAALSAEYGIGVRNGCFCAQPYVAWLLGMDDAEVESRFDHPPEPGSMRGAVRASMGLDTTEAEVDRLAVALEELSERGTRLEYAVDPATGEARPVNDPRTPPRFTFLPELEATEAPGCQSI